MEKSKIVLYGADWCPKTSELRNYLQSEWLDFAYHNVDVDEPAATRLRTYYEGKLKFPTVVVGEKPLKNPKVPALRDELRAAGLL